MIYPSASVNDVIAELRLNTGINSFSTILPVRIRLNPGNPLAFSPIITFDLLNCNASCPKSFGIIIGSNKEVAGKWIENH